MLNTSPIRPVKLIIAVLFSHAPAWRAAEQALAAAFGPIDYFSPIFPFEKTEYYAAEMGVSIHRLFCSFENLISPGELAAIKWQTHALERKVAQAGKRRVNLDPGYLDTDKFVLASTKYHGYKVYLAEGIWADMTLHYEKGKFTAFPWSFPDFKDRRYEREFLHLRVLYKKQLRQINRA